MHITSRPLIGHQEMALHQRWGLAVGYNSECMQMSRSTSVRFSVSNNTFRRVWAKMCIIVIAVQFNLGAVLDYLFT